MEPPIVSIATLLLERELADEFVASLHAGRIEEKFFYWLPLSVRAWLALCSDGEYRNYVRSQSLIARSSDEIAALLPTGSLDVVSLGSGQGDKDLILLEALRRGGRHVTYRPVDASQALLEMACSAAVGSGFEAHGVKADIGRSDHLARLAPDGHDPPRLVMMIGNTLGAFDPAGTAGRLAGLLRPADVLLVDGELYAGRETMAGYDNELNRRFAWGPLNSVGIGDEDGDIVFESADDPARPGLHAVAKHFEARRDVEAVMAGEALHLERGDRVEMSRSRKYDPGALGGLLETAGLTVRWEGASDDDRFVMDLVTPT
ncbi:MAG: L-histidine N(alpha)-methyltransferase [Actinomycetota bacterium]